MQRLLLIGLFTFGLSAHASYAGDTYNIRFSPIGLLVGSINLNLDYKIAEYWTLGPELNFWHLGLSGSDYSATIDTFGGGLRGNWFANGAYVEGLYVGPSLTYAGASLKYSSSSNGMSDSGTYTESVFLLGALVGYAWFWDSFNIMLGGGAKVSLGNDTMKTTRADGSTDSFSTHTTGLALEFSLGWKF